jgi:hypothetical protein
VALREDWGGSLHQTFRLLPRPSDHLPAFLDADGSSPKDILARLPYAPRRSGTGAGAPDPRRYRDGKQVYQTVGLLYEGSDGRVHLTELGHAVHRWLAIVNDHNFFILARHAAYALAACQLRNPTGAGQAYAAAVVVHPFRFIWEAMLKLEGRISTEELNRSLFKVRNHDELDKSIEAIAEARAADDPNLMGPPTITGTAPSDRVIPWMSLASFGWTLIRDKRSGAGDYYEIPPQTYRLVADAAQIRHKHRDFADVPAYVSYVAACASLPRDVR